MPLSPFDLEFQSVALPALYDAFGFAADYKPTAGGQVTHEGVLIIKDEQEADHGSPISGKGRLSSMSRIWRCQTAQLTPFRNGVLVVGGVSYSVSEKPLEDNGEWKFPVVKL